MKKNIKKLFKPQLTPKKMLELGVFGGSYFSGTDIKEFPKSWFEKAKLSKRFDVKLNRFRVKSGLSRQEWIKKGWIFKEDPLGWFQWYCDFFFGERYKCDKKMIERWLKHSGPDGNLRLRLVKLILYKTGDYRDPAVSPSLRQSLLHWGYHLTNKDYEIACNRI